MPENLTIRHATQTEQPQLSILQMRSLSALASSSYTPEMRSAILSNLEIWNKRLIQTRQLLVALNRRKIVACGGWSEPDPAFDPAPAFAANWPLVRNLYVDPDFVRRGIGRRMLAEIGRRTGGDLQLIALLNAVGMYAACGFIPVGHLVHRLAGDVEVTGVHMITSCNATSDSLEQEVENVGR